MKILVTGATGFLGQNLQEVFLKNGYANNHKLRFPINRTCVDLTNEQETYQYLEAHRDADAILHMSALAGGILANKNSPARFLTDNLKMGINIFEGARKAGIEKIYTLGSVCSYPKFCPPPFKEDDIWNGYPEETNACYGHAKRTLMLLGQSYRAQYGIGGAHLIPVNMFGKFDHFDLVNSHVIPALINKFVTAVAQGQKTVKCWGSGEFVTREFIFAQDVAEVLLQSVINGLDTDLPINIGTGVEISIKDLAYLIAELTNFRGDIVFTGEVSDGQPRRQLDISRAKEMLGWTAKTNLRDGLIKTIQYFKDTYGS